MATPSPAPQPQSAPAVNGAADLELDVTKLHSLDTAQQDLYLLTFVSDLQRHVEQLSAEALPSHQASIKKEVIKIVGLGAPVPSRVIRNALGRILADVFARGSRSLLYETINDLLAILNTGKADKELSSKHSAIVCIGAVFRAAGDSAISLSGLTAASLIKLLKASSVGVRGCVFRALVGVVLGVKGSLDEHVSRDILKAARNAATSDKSTFVQRCACSCLRSLVSETSYFNNSNDFESLKSTIWKVLDSSGSSVRHAAAAAMAASLQQAYSATGHAEVPVLRKPKKSKKPGDDLEEEAEIERPGSPAPGQVKPSVRLTLTLTEVLRVLSQHYCRASTTNRARAGIAMCYRFLLRLLPRKPLEEEYASIATHMYADLLNHPTISANRHRLLLTRKLVQWMLADVTVLLTENAQINAARHLINDVLKNYPQVMPERREPSKRILAGALTTLNDLLLQLGPAANVLQDSCREALFQVVQHPSHTVQSHAAQCFKAFILACPNQLTRTIDHAMAQLQKEFQPSEGKQPHRRSLGFATAIAIAVSCARQKPLYGSVQTYFAIFTFATDLLKSSAAAELRLSAMQVQVAWTLIGGVVSLGPSFVKVHLNQLMLMWRNALPPPLTHENASRRGHLELSFLSHVRECALSALLMFLSSCSGLITFDGSKRISTMLHNTILFLNSLPPARESEDLSHRLVPALQLQDFAILLRRRVLQCFASLVSLRHLEQTEVVSQSDLIGLTMTTFTDPERPVLKSLEASLANTASTFEGLWTTEDNWSFGVSSLVDHFDTYLPFESHSPPGSDMYTDQDVSVPDILLRCPAIPAIEHDAALIARQDTSSSDAELSSPATSCVNLSIKLFAISLPLQSGRIQESTIEQLITTVSQQLQREPGRKAAMQVNAALALLCALAVANNETPYTSGKMNVGAIGQAIIDLLGKYMCSSDPALRHIAARAIGRICNLAGTQFTNKEVKFLIDMIVANRDPSVRAGCALALGHIHSEVGAMAASLHIKSIVGVLLSLCSDTHTIVHFWALKGLVLVAESAGLAFSTYATSTLGLLAQLYSNDSHNEEAASLTTSNFELELFTPLAIAQCVDSVVNVLGPDLQDVSKARNLILVLVGYLQKEASAQLRSESYQCLRHLCMYAPAHLQFAKYVLDLQANLLSDEELLQSAAVKGLDELMKRNASEVARVATSKLGDDLWARLDDNPGSGSLQAMLQNWMQQTILLDTADWVDKCQSILSRTRAKAPLTSRVQTATVKTAMPDLADEDVAGLTAAAGGQGDAADAAPEGQEFLRWQTRDFAMRLLSEAMDIIHAGMSPDRVIHAEEVLQSKVADVVRVAFSASTANVVELRIWGLRIIDQILKLFGKTPDPDFLEASLLEQYQAQISSALTPAFAADSSPELAAEAIGVCATFVATGIVTNAERMGRIFKVLALGVDNLTRPTPEAAIGDLNNLSPNAQAMLKMAILSGWAQLQLASADQPYLEEILQPFIPKLAPLWLTSLQEFASLRFEPEISDTLGGEVAGGNLDERYASFNREVRLKFYQTSWLSVVDAIAVLVEKDSESVFDALDNKRVSAADGQANGTATPGKDMSFREEPVAFFFILFGLAFEALVTQAREDPSQVLSILQALRKILTPEVCGNAIYEDAVFNETTDTLDRLALTSTRETQSELVEIARNLSLDHIAAKNQDRDDKLSDDIEQLFELTRIIILVLTGLIPTLEDPPGVASRRLGDDGIALVQLCFQALVDVASVFPAIIRADLHACIMHSYCTILATGICQDAVLPRIMPIFKAFLQDVIQSAPGDVASRLVRGCLRRMLSILAVAQRRENEHAITCAKNTLLSMTILLTTASSVLPANDDSVAQSLSELLDCLQDVGLAKIAAGCMRSLLVTHPKSACDEVVGRALWTRLVQFVSDHEAEDPESVKAALTQALVAAVVTIKDSGRPAAMSILVPVLLLRAKQVVPAAINSETMRKESAARLLELVAADQIAFKVTVGLLDEEQRSELESLLRAAGVGKRQEKSAEENVEARPAIELRMDFG
ncbi:HEAT repeat protein [Cladophialophora carrionii]|uniref:HEAT repeat protein n=1 Tax=Cladophialophora carrionii TaxID=86049 RepID=A0A1C1D2E1_9EURO|nr:HEAT repeat protein [Cladophialophora carrionii]